MHSLTPFSKFLGFEGMNPLWKFNFNFLITAYILTNYSRRDTVPHWQPPTSEDILTSPSHDHMLQRIRRSYFHEQNW